jgi:hypothetical protein
MLQLVSRLLGLEACQAHQQHINAIALAQQHLVGLMALGSGKNMTAAAAAVAAAQGYSRRLGGWQAD